MKRFIVSWVFFLILAWLSYDLLAQTPDQNCIGAISVCNTTYTQNNSYVGPGTNSNEVVNTCLMQGENNSVWYTFQVQTSGTFIFTINTTVDYDFALYDITGLSCANVPSLAPIRCNYSATQGTTGLTLPPGPNTPQAINAAGSPTMPGLNVTAGQQFVLVVDNYTGGPTGYSITFGGTATIFDQTPPALASVPTTGLTCGATQFTVNFTENVTCSSIGPSDFAVTGPGGPYTVTAVACPSGATYSDQFTFTVSPGLGPGNFTITQVGPITDACGNTSSGSSANFTVVNNLNVTASVQGTGGTPVTIFFTDFNNPASNGWQTVDQSSGTNSLQANFWTIDCQETGTHANGVCNTTTTFGGSCNNSTNSLFITSTLNALFPGARYNASNATNKRSFSQPINTTGATGLNLSFNYIMQGQPGFDFASVIYSINNGPWVTLQNLNTTQVCGANRARWTTVNIPLPAVLENQPNVRIGFNWTNDGATGTDPSIAIDSIRVTRTQTGSSTTICGGQSVTLQASGANTYTWSPATGLSSTTGSSVTASPTVSTTYTVTGVGAGGCTGSATVVVNVQPGTTITVSSPDSLLCPGESTTLTASGGTTYTWSPATGLSSTTGTSVTANPPTTTTYTVTSNIGPCTASATYVVVRNTNPTVTATAANPTICTGQSTTLTASGATSYTWSPATGLSSTTGSTVTANPTTTTTYTVTGTANGCSAGAIFTLTVLPTPNLSVTSPDTTLCPGQSTTITASGATAYTWSPATGLSSTTGASVTANPTTTTTYTVTGQSGSCSASRTIVIIRNPDPSVTVSATLTSVCPGQSTTLTASGAVSYTWSPATGLSSTTGSTVTATPTATTTYTVTGTDANGCTNTASVEIVLTTNPTINVLATPPDICEGQSSTITASGAVSYTWSPATGLNTTTGPTVIATPTTTTTYSVSGVNSAGCQASGSVVIVVTPNPTVVITPSSASICSGQSTTLSASGAISYTWSPASGLSSATGSTVTANPTSTTTYTVTGSVNASCTDTEIIVVTVNPLPNVSISPASANICPGSSTTLTASGANAYSWLPSSGLTILSPSTVSASPTTTTTYTLTGVDVNGCSNTATATVTVLASPNLVINASSDSICEGQSTTITVTGAVSYTWSPATGLSSTTGATVTANPTVTTTYTVAAVDANQCQGSDSIVISVFSIPIVTLSPTSAMICVGESAILTASGADNYVWNPASGLSSTTGSSVTASPTTTTTYTVRGITGPNCFDTETVVVTVNPLPTVSVSSFDPVLCPTETATLLASGAQNYTWSPATGLNSTTGSIVVADPAVTTTYTVTGTDGNGCTNSASIVVTRLVVNPIQIVASDSSLCEGDSTILSVNGLYNNLVWSPATGLSATSGSVVIARPMNTTTYTVTGLDLNGCPTNGTYVVVIDTLPNFSVSSSSPNNIVCYGTSVTLTATGADAYLWYPNYQISDTVGSTVTVSPLNDMYYYVVGITNAGCSKTDSIFMDVNFNPQMTLFLVDDSLCPGQVTEAYASGFGMVNFQWYPSTGLSDSIGWDVRVSPTTATTYTVIGWDWNGCQDTAYMDVHVSDTLNIWASNDTTICRGDQVRLEVQGAGYYIWSLENGETSPTIWDSTNWHTIVRPFESTVYRVIGFDMNYCQDTEYVSVEVHDVPEASFTFDTTDGLNLPDAMVQFNNGSIGASSYHWSFGNGDTSITENPSYNYTAPGNYMVTLIARNNLCADTVVEGPIHVYNLIRVFIPNAFTPNGDALNNTLIYTSDGLTEIEFRVYNRWGYEVFNNEKIPGKFWDGKDKSGNDCQEDAYTYILKAKKIDGSIHEEVGTVTLLR
ncbi:MAG: gliding motility-associated C-terminal domain-containing protein [Bacteroidia bacterium]|nr:gliding motility-associated C-terminal domain-containing protein [Bacteroidia bacterium]